MLLSLRFSDQSAEQRFLDLNRKRQAQQFWKVTIVALAVAWATLWQDSIISPIGYVASDIRMYAMTPTCIIAIWSLAYDKVPRKFVEPLIAVTYVFYTLCFLLIEIVFEGNPKFGLASSVGAGTLLLATLSGFTFTYLRFWWSMLVGLLILMMYAGGMALVAVPWIREYLTRGFEVVVPATLFQDFLVGDFITAVTAGLVGASTSLFRERARRDQFLASEAMSREREQYRTLLYTLVPETIAERIQSGEFPIAESHAEVTIMFADLVGFTALTRTRAPRQIVQMLNELFQAFDEAALRHNVEKIKTIGDGYMAICGPPVNEDQRAIAVARFAKEVLACVATFSGSGDVQLQMRIGIHTGSVVAGVIGRSRLTYDVWGDAVNIASRMDATGTPGKVHISEDAYQRLWKHFECEARENIEVRGVGMMKTYFLGEAKDHDLITVRPNDAEVGSS